MPRAGKKCGKQSVWLSTVMSYTYNQRPSDSASTNVLAGTRFRRTYTTLLHADGEDVKVVPKLLRRGLSRITMDVYDTGKAQGAGEIGRDAAGHREEDELRIIVFPMCPRGRTGVPASRSFCRRPRRYNLEPVMLMRYRVYHVCDMSDPGRGGPA
jgi:hypothetical protein